MGEQSPGAPGADAVTAGAVARAQARVVVALRWVIVPAWLAAAVYAALTVAAPKTTANVVSLVPPGAPAIRVARHELRLFRVPLSAETMVVQSAPHGISAVAQARSLALAARVDRRAVTAPDGGGPVVVPVPNTWEAAPGSRASGTAIVSYLEFPPTTSAGAVVRSAHEYASTLRHRSGSVAGVTGIVPAEWHEGTLIQDRLDLVELATVIVIALVVGLKFRSVGAAVLTLASVGIASLCADQALVWAQSLLGVSVPGFLRPMQIALILGVGTDYCIFYLSAFRRRAQHGEPHVAAARAVSAETTPIVIVGALILAVVLGSLEVARVSFFRNLGPGLAVTVLTTMVVATTFVPAALAAFGRPLLWPSGAAPAGATPPPARPSRRAAFLTRRPVAMAVAALVVAGLGAGVWQLRLLRVGFTEVTGLPAWTQERSAYKALQQGFAPGMLSPSRVIVSGRNLTSNTAPLVRFQSELRRQPGVAAVIGPADQPLGDRLGLIYGQRGDAARYIVILDRDPFGAGGIHVMAGLRARIHRLADRAGLQGRSVGVTGATALAQETTAAMHADVLRISLVVLAASFLLLALYLRAVVAPAMLVAASALSVGATLGITAWVFSRLLGYGELTYYVPYASAVLLIALGSDYNVFVTGRMWQEARRRPLRAAVAVAGPSAGEAVRTAGVILAASFAAVAIIPVRGFREFAFAMTLGIALETFVVRSVLVPTMISAASYASGWPGRALRRGPAAVPDGDA
jgi:putative drug exporter of the RND superfamily